MEAIRPLNKPFYHMRYCFSRYLVPFLGIPADAICRLTAFLEWQLLQPSLMEIFTFSFHLCIFLDKPLLSSKGVVSVNCVKLCLSCCSLEQSTESQLTSTCFSQSHRLSIFLMPDKQATWLIPKPLFMREAAGCGGC